MPKLWCSKNEIKKIDVDHKSLNISDSYSCQFLKFKNNNNIGSELALETFSVNTS